MLPKNVGLAVAVEIGRRRHMPRGPRIGKVGDTSDRGAVHGPDRRQAAVVLPKNIGLAVAVEIGRSSDMPRGPNIGQDSGVTRRRVGIVQRVKPGAQALAGEHEG